LPKLSPTRRDPQEAGPRKFARHGDDALRTDTPLRFGQRLLNHRADPFRVFSARYLRHHAVITLRERDLRGDHTHWKEYVFPSSDEAAAHSVAGRLNPQDPHHRPPFPSDARNGRKGKSLLHELRIQFRRVSASSDDQE
jgi:hypothetical protein